MHCFRSAIKANLDHLKPATSRLPPVDLTPIECVFPDAKLDFELLYIYVILTVLF